MRVLVTGNKGFIGRRVEQRLIDAGCDVVGYDITDGYDILNLHYWGKGGRMQSHHSPRRH